MHNKEHLNITYLEAKCYFQGRFTHAIKGREKKHGLGCLVVMVDGPETMTKEKITILEKPWCGTQCKVDLDPNVEFCTDNRKIEMANLD